MYHGSGGGVGLDQLWLVGLDRGNWWVSRWRLVGLDQWSWWVSWWRLVDFWVNVCYVYGFVGSFDGGSDGEFFFILAWFDGGFDGGVLAWFELML